ncbi:ABC transporter ATP-binding protein [Umezawaea sp. NPDC059074]|uniref:ABC transporter ATP-binding protein n=1 Tax=Umezawaea sp. NPDC059074 TaxID=3346716 RepID=UPI0036A03B06
MTALDARSLYRFFHTGDEETLALQGVSLSVDAGEFVVVTGPSGSGKSTLLACLAGVDEPDGGTVRVAGERLSHRPEPERARMRARHIGVVFQSGNLLDHLTVRQNVRLVRSLARSRTPIASVLESAGIAHRADALPRTLSGGESARAALAVATAGSQTVLLADEPTGELDGDTEELVLRLLRGLADAGGAVLVASHSSGVARAADRVVELLDGRVVA